MFLLNKPTTQELASFLAAQENSSFSYPQVGASRNDSPATYNIDHNRVQLGKGEEVFVRARKAIQSWKMFDLGWCSIYPGDPNVEVGVTVVAVINHFGFWSLNASRVVYLFEEDGDYQKYGFAYGTLTEHGEIGEERFSVEWNQQDGSVWYDLYAFSRPGHLLAKIGYPISRMLQKRFAQDSKLAMVKAVQADGRI